MLKWVKYISVIVVAPAVLLAIFTHSLTYARIQSACTVNLTPNDVEPASGNNFTISITNNDVSDSIQWIDFLVPPTDFIYSGNSISDWSTADHAGGTTLTGNTIGPQQSEAFSLSAISDIYDANPENWQIQASTDPSGSNAYTCSGSLSTSVSGSLPNDTDTGVENVTVANVTDTTATITWDSDSPISSLIYYGPTSNYGNSSVNDQTLNTSHSVTLTGLSPNTGYHYQVVGSDGQGNFGYSADDTFLTASAPIINSPPVINVGPTTTKPTTRVLVKNTTPPQVSINTKLVGVYRTAPTFSGSASDKNPITKVEYSTDSGQNWLPVDELNTAGQKNVDFYFTPLITQDGNYNILIQVTDSIGNTATTAPQILIINTLPPVVGGNIFSAGPQIIEPDSSGVIDTQVGANLRITLSAIGGPTNISIDASSTSKTKVGNPAFNQNFNLTPSQDNGLWSGIVGFTKPGLYTLIVNATNGSGTRTSRVLNDVYVSSPGQTTNSATNKPVSAKVTIYSLDPESQTWVVWDGSAFDQINPESTNKSGDFSMILPAGKYYVQAIKQGYRKYVGSIFTVNKPTALALNIRLIPQSGLHIGSHYLSIPSLSVQSTKLNVINTPTTQNNLIGKLAPDFNLSDTDGYTVHAANLLGRPTLISFGSTWSPTTEEQLSALSQLQNDSNFNIFPVALQDNSSLVTAYSAIANVNLNWLVDPDSTMSNSYNVQSLPMNYFIDRNGYVRYVFTGVMSKQQMYNELSSL